MKEYLKNASKEMKNIHSLIGASLLGALNPILGMLTIHINQFLQIGFSSLTHAVTGYLYGPVLAMFAGGILDILKWIIKPDGRFFIGFTINEMLDGLIFGFALYKKPVTLKRVIITRVIITFLINLTLTPLWLSIMYGKAYKVMVPLRIFKNLAMIPIDVIILYTLLKFREKNIKPNLQNKK
ncbi:MAG: folate family ECF transporter S component [Oscillospiraceae bacterium]|nr:folate family ECF transporter S component [Oscillospiraceae bacterium]